MRTCLSPFARVVDRAVREAMPGIKLSAEIVRLITMHLRTSLIAHMRQHSELTIQGFGTFRRERQKTPILLNRNKTTLRITFTPVKTLEQEATDAMD